MESEVQTQVLALVCEALIIDHLHMLAMMMMMISISSKTRPET